MIILKDHNLVFVHIPKTAGTSIISWAQENLNTELMMSPHAGMHQMSQRQIIDLRKHMFFTVVRNPFARQLSHYMYHLNSFQTAVMNDQEKKIENVRNTRILKDLEKGFEHWFIDTQEYVMPQQRWWNYKWTNQCDWIIPSMTHVMRFEMLEDQISWLFHRTKCYNKPLSRLNSTGSYQKDYKDHYSQKLRKIVEEKFERDLTVFKYSF